MIYLDHHATTPCDPNVIEEMLPWLGEQYGNPHSSSHEMGRHAAAATQEAIENIANSLGCAAANLLMTSGATESINLAMRGVMLHPRNRRTHLVVVTTEHQAVFDVANDLKRDGIEVTSVGVYPQGHASAGQVDLDALQEATTERTALVNVMLANNETGVIAPIADVAKIAHQCGALLHCDATQAVGRIDVNVARDDIDLLSGSSHKFYGPKGVGLLVAGNGHRRVRLRPQIVGGGQQQGLRSGTMNPAGVIAMSAALEIGLAEQPQESIRLSQLRQRLFEQLSGDIDGLQLNGPPITVAAPTETMDRLPGNLNLCLPGVEGEALMSATPEVAFSSGSACSGSDASPSHVLTAMGLSEAEARRSVRFGIGRFNTVAEIDSACDLITRAYRKLSL